jgi:hypothetical protein
MLAFLVALIVFVMTFPFAVALAVPLRKSAARNQSGH